MKKDKNNQMNSTSTTHEMDQKEKNNTNIPMIIHQNWDTYLIPQRFIPWIKSMHHNHPKWQYWFWTQDDVRCLLRKHFPEYVQMYNSYLAPIFRSDAMRYFVLYQFGGIYLDLDFKSLKPMDDLIDKYKCFLSYDRLGWYFVSHRHVPTVMNGVMACKQKHPLFKKMIETLPSRQEKYPQNWLYATGPFLLDSIFKEFFKTAQDNGTDNVTLLSYKYFLPTFSYETKKVFKDMCLNVGSSSEDSFTRKLCHHFHDIFLNHDKPTDDSYSNHYWVHSQAKSADFRLRNAVPIHKIVPNVIRPKDILGCS